MKRILAFGLASAMALSMNAAVLARDNDALYPVGSISTNAYLYDDDLSAVDLSNPVDSVAYGETIFYPLLNNGSEDAAQAIAEAQALLDQKNAELTDATNAYNNAVSDAAEKAEALEAAATAKQNAQAVLDAANAWNDGTGTQEAYNEALAAFDSEATPKDTAGEAVTNATDLVSNANGAFTQAETDANNADALVTTTESAKNNAEQAVTDAQTALDALVASNTQYVFESDAVDGIKIKQKWDMNSRLINGVELVKKKVAGGDTTHKYIYFIAIGIKDSGSTTAADISGTIQLRKSGEFDYEDMELAVDIEIAYEISEDNEITEDIKLFKEGHGFNGEEDEEFTFECDDDTYFEVNTIGQGKILLSATSDFDERVSIVYPNANLNFFYGNGGTFNKTGTLYLAAESGSYLYQLKDDGRLVKVDAEYDEYDECFVIRTRTLGRYVISDVQLPLLNTPIVGDGASNNGSNGTVTSPSNPVTGAEV